jgi:hypothetical protein
MHRGVAASHAHCLVHSNSSICQGKLISSTLVHVRSFSNLAPRIMEPIAKNSTDVEQPAPTASQDRAMSSNFVSHVVRNRKVILDTDFSYKSSISSAACHALDVILDLNSQQWQSRETRPCPIITNWSKLSQLPEPRFRFIYAFFN